MFSQSASAHPHIAFDLIVASLPATTHKQLVRLAAHEIAKIIGISERILAERLADKERENPSAIGDGLAISHLQMSGLKNPLNVFIRLKNPVVMDAPDSKPVDLICILLTPEREGSVYLRTLARLSRLLRNAQICARLRAAANEKEIAQILDQSSSGLMAA